MNSQSPSEIQYAGFLIPIVNGHIYLGQRGTPPHQGKWGAIGGKSDTGKKGLFSETPRMIIKPGGHLAPSNADITARIDGREYILETCVREAFEELYTNCRYPTDFTRSAIPDIALIGSIDDIYHEKQVVAYFALGRLTCTTFCLSTRELTGFQPINQIPPEEIYPLTQIALMQLRWVWENGYDTKWEKYRPFSDCKLLEQIPEIKITERRFTDMSGAAVTMKEQRLPR